MRRMIRPCLAISACLLAACSPRAPDGAYRNTTTPIYSNAVFRQDRFAGRWLQIADFAPAGSASCAAGGIAVTPGAGEDFNLQADLCLGGERLAFNGTAAMTGPGRLRLLGADPSVLGADWWVLWVDDGYRTVVIGTPSGRFGMILNREATLPPDRLAAAREILDWNGYDLARMRPVGQP